jgi:predicted phosphodiesterase
VILVVCTAGCNPSSSPDTDGGPTVDANTNPTGDGGIPPDPMSLTFAIVGDTRPPNPDDTAHYPTAIATMIWKDVAKAAPDFAISTGDYMFANTTGTQQNPQLDLYLGARANYHGVVYAAMGNHECTGATASNCGMGASDGITQNYNVFMQRMVQPLGQDKPYFVVHAHAPDNSWKAKFVFVACNAWSSTQQTWLTTALSESTDYTFVVRHEGTSATTAPCEQPSDTIIQAHPLTLLIVGHTHTYEHYATDHEVIVGNGGAPLTGNINYGYVLVDRRASDGAIEVTAHDYADNSVTGSFKVHADGSAAQ